MLTPEAPWTASTSATPGTACWPAFFLEAIDAELGTTTDRVDLGEVIAGDRRSPVGLAADGFDRSLCED